MTTDSRVALVTGARDEGRGRAAVEGLAGQGLAARSVRLDVGDEGSVAEAAAAIEGWHGRLDILVNNAGIFDTADGPPSTASLAAVRRVMETNVLGTLAVRYALGSEGSGRFVEPGGETPW